MENVNISDSENALINSPTNLSKLKTALSKFFYSEWYLISVALFTVIFWVLDLTAAGVIIIALLASLVLIVCEDSMPILPLFMMGFMIFNGFPDFGIWVYIVSITIFLSSCIYHCIKNKVKLKFNATFFAFLAFVPIFLISGITNWTCYTETFPAMLANVALLLAYALFFLLTYSSFKHDGKTYICKTLLYMACIVLIELLIFYIRKGDFFYSFFNIPPHLGWGQQNNVPIILLYAMPAIAYLSTKSKNGHWLYLLIAACVFAVFQTRSRGSIYAMLPCLLFLLIFTVIKSKNRYKSIITILSIIFAGLFLVSCFSSEFSGFLSKFESTGAFGDSGRMKIYKRAIQKFFQFPIFGEGVATYFFYESTYYHCSILEAMTSCGIFGLLAMLFFMFKKYYLPLKNWQNSFNIFMIIAMLMPGLYALIDVVYWTHYGILPLIPILILLDKENRSKNLTLKGKDKKSPTSEDKKTIESTVPDSSNTSIEN